MATREAALHAIYGAMVQEATRRLNAATGYLATFSGSKSAFEVESAVLQLRKALEAIALAAIAPNKAAYAAFRATATSAPDFTKDYHAQKIFTALERINANFYPVALLPAKRMSDGTFHFGRKQTGFLSKKRFQAIYDRLGKYLHTDNPWGNPKHLNNLALELPITIEEAHSLLELHVTFIQTPTVKGAWVIEADRHGGLPRVIQALASGEFSVKDS